MTQTAQREASAELLKRIKSSRIDPADIDEAGRPQRPAAGVCRSADVRGAGLHRAPRGLDGGRLGHHRRGFGALCRLSEPLNEKRLSSIVERSNPAK